MARKRNAMPKGQLIEIVTKLRADGWTFLRIAQHLGYSVRHVKRVQYGGWR